MVELTESMGSIDSMGSRFVFNIGGQADDLWPSLGVLAPCAGGRCERGRTLPHGGPGYYRWKTLDILYGQMVDNKQYEKKNKK